MKDEGKFGIQRGEEAKKGELRQYVVQTFCRNVDLAAKWNKKKNKPKEHYQKCKRSTTWKV